MYMKSERLAYWYLRLNGFLTIPNFVVHPDRGGNQGTDIDVLGVRFPYRAENLERPMLDDVRFTRVREKSFIAIAEVKRGRCALNESWINPERKNMLRVLRAVGAFPRNEADLVAQSLCQKGFYRSQLYHVSLMCFGCESNPELAGRYRQVPQFLWPEVLAFIYRRFQEYKRQKASHEQWDEDGIALWNEFEHSRNEHQFEQGIAVQ